mgnify:CR=1 FL=1
MGKKRKKQKATPPEGAPVTLPKGRSPMKRRQKTPLILWWVVGIAALPEGLALVCDPRGLPGMGPAYQPGATLGSPGAANE